MPGGLSKIIATLLSVASDAQAAASGCALMGRLAALPSCRTELEAAADQVARALVAVLRAHEPGVRDARAALEEACTALAAILAAVPAVGDRFLEAGGAAPLARLVALPSAEIAFLVSCASQALGRIAARPSSSDCAADAGVALLESMCVNAVASLLAALRQHAARPHVVAEAASALASVSRHSVGCTACVAAGPAGAKCLMDALISPAAESAAVPDAAATPLATREASRALAILTGHAGCCAVLSAAGAQETLLRALTTTGSHDAAFFKAASAAPANLTASAAAAGAAAAAAAATGPNADSAAPLAAPLPSVSILPLAEALRGHVNDADVASDVCAAVHNVAIAGGSAGRAQVVASSLVADICAALRAHVAHPGLALAACRALRFLSATRSALPPAAAADAASALVAALEAHGGDARSSVAKAACAALRNLAWGGGRRVQVEVALAGGVEALLGALAVANAAPQGRTARVVASQACRALACIAASGPDVAEGLALSGGVAALVGALGAHGTDVDVARAALRALGHALAGGGTEAGSAIVACGGVPAIAAALRAHATALPVLRAGAAALRTLAGLSPSLAAAAESAGVPAALKGALGMSAGSAEKTQANDAEFLALLELLQRRAQEQESAGAAGQ